MKQGVKTHQHPMDSVRLSVKSPSKISVTLVTGRTMIGRLNVCVFDGRTNGRQPHSSLRMLLADVLVDVVVCYW